MESKRLAETLTGIAKEYPADLADAQLRDIPRIAFHISLTMMAVGDRPHRELTICDLGGGIGLYSVGCAALGFKRVVLIDDFQDPVNRAVGDSIFSLHRKYGVEVISTDVIQQGMQDIVEGDFDVITTFDSMEHWHHSPKKLFQDAVAKLRHGGVFILGAPNCVNMRKRIAAPLGKGGWSDMQDWYEEAVFRGHVREPNIYDLKYIAADMRLADTQVFGRNWMGLRSANPVIRSAAVAFDHLLRLRPSLCSDIYMIGRKPRINCRL